MPGTLICDCETDGLLDSMSRLWCLQIGPENGDEVTVYADQPGFRPIAEGVVRLRQADHVVFHNGLGFDMDAINRFYPTAITIEHLYDTLVLARLMDPVERIHTLKAWGERTGTAKGEYAGDFQSFTPDLVEYAIQDIHTGRALWHKVKHVLEWGRVVEVEHKFARAMVLQERRGFTLNVKKAEAFAVELRGRLSELDHQLQEFFPPLPMSETFVPKVNNKLRGYVKGEPFVRRWEEAFDPASRHHVGRRLQALGWKPRKFGRDGVPTVDGDILQALPYPAARALAERFVISKRLAQLSDGKTGWLRVVQKDGRVHGRVKPIGCAPGRCAHTGPNLANVEKKDLRMREVWEAQRGWKLVGVDADGLQARIFAHYVARYDGGEFASRLINGSKKDRTDIHSANAIELAKIGALLVNPATADQELWDRVRDASKRGLYATWFGAQNRKLGWTLKDGAKNAGLKVPRYPDTELGALARVALMRAIRGYGPLVQALESAVKEKGYLRSPLGRHVPIKSRHSMLVYLEQAGEADAMKLAEVIFNDRVSIENGWKYGTDFAGVAHVHDERQIEARPEIAEEIGAAYAECIRMAGEEMGLRCPLLGSFNIGETWRATH